MTGTTHLMMGAVAGTLAVAVVGSNDWPKEVLIGVAAFAATLPDLDTEWSLIQKILLRHTDPNKRRSAIRAAGIGLICLTPFSSGFLLAGLFMFLASVFPHRTFTHSILALGMITWATYILEQEWTTAVFVGYLSHLVADSMTPHGVPWLWPHNRCFRIAQIRTGSWMDHIIGLTAFFGAFFIWLIL